MEKIIAKQQFSVHYFAVPMITDGCPEPDGKRFWKQTELNEIKNGRGVYIFARRIGKNYTPFYIGVAKNTFNQETFTADKLIKCQRGKHEKKGELGVFFIVARTNNGKISTRQMDELLLWLEEHLITQALLQGKPLLNKSNTTNLQRVIIPDILNSSKGISNTESRKLKKALS